MRGFGSMKKMRETRRNAVKFTDTAGHCRTMIAQMQYRRNETQKELDKIEIQRQKFMDAFDERAEEIAAKQRRYDKKIKELIQTLKEREKQGLTGKKKGRTITATVGD